MILAMDTSAASGSIALLKDGRLVSERTVGDAGPHARWLLAGIKALLDDFGLAPRCIDLYAVAVGPGSFTGLRIGISTAKGLAWSSGRPVAPVSTLPALAMNAPFSAHIVCPVLDARKSEVYAGLYASEDGRLRAIMEPAALTPEALLGRMDELVPEGTGVVFLGSGLDTHGAVLREGRRGAVIAPEPLWHVRASNIALLASEEGAVTLPPGGLVPLYLRKSEAELGRLARRGG